MRYAEVVFAFRHALPTKKHAESAVKRASRAAEILSVARLSPILFFGCLDIYESGVQVHAKIILIRQNQHFILRFLHCKVWICKISARNHLRSVVRKRALFDTYYPVVKHAYSHVVKLDDVAFFARCKRC